MGEQGIVLEDHADVAALRWHERSMAAHARTVDAYFTLANGFEAGYAAQNGRFSAAAGTQKASYGAAVEHEGQALDDGMVAVGLVNVFEFQNFAVCCCHDVIINP